MAATHRYCVTPAARCWYCRIWPLSFSVWSRAINSARAFDLPRARAELIARDQTLKLNGQIRQYQQRAAGVTQYRWVAMLDERTRDQHRELDNSIHSWDAPPEVAPGRYEHPGGDYQCRCQAEPILPWLDE